MSFDIPEGWQLVPIEPTERMLDIFAGTKHIDLPLNKQASERKAYAAMLRAAPTPPEARAVDQPVETAKRIRGWMFHPDASHVPPDYRDGWNAALGAAALRIEVDSFPVAAPQPDDDSFDAVIRNYAQACATGNKAGMREGYIKLREMCASAVPPKLTEPEMLNAADAKFPDWRIDIQERFVVELSRAVEALVRSQFGIKE